MTFFVPLSRCVLHRSWSALAVCWFACLAFLLNFGASAEAANTFSLIKSGSTEVFSGVPFDIEVRAGLDLPLAAIGFTLTATGEGSVTMTGRSASPRGGNGLVFVSDLSQDPYDAGLPRQVGDESATPEVLLHTGAFPYDAIGPGPDLLVERLTLSASRTGTVTIRLGDVEAASTLWIRDGTMVTDISVDPAELTLTVLEAMAGDLDLDADVDGIDLLLLVQCAKGEVPVSDPVYQRADLDGDDDVDSRDVFMLGSRFGAGMASQAAKKGFPEPGSGTGGSAADAVNWMSGEPNRLSLESVDAMEDRLIDWAGAVSIQAPAVAAIEPDANGDRDVDAKDLVYVRVRLGQDPASGGDLASADVNADGNIDLVDLVSVRNRVGWRGNYYFNLRISELVTSSTPGEPSWIEIMNSSPRFISIDSDFQIFDSEGYLYYFGRFVRANPGMPIQIVFDGPGDPEYFGTSPNWDAIRFHADPGGSDPFPSSGGRCVLMWRLPFGSEFVALDEIEWGTGEERTGYYNFIDRPLPDGGSVGRDGYETDQWVRFPEASPLEPNPPLAPEPLCPTAGEIVFSATTTQFLWSDPRYTAMAYRLQIAATESFDIPLVDEAAVGTVHDVSPALAPGDYVWRVRAEAGEFVSPWSATTPFTVEPFPAEILSPGGAEKIVGPESPAQSTTVMLEPFKASGFLPRPGKDSNMVCLECRTEGGFHDWDKPHQVWNPCEHDMGYGMYAGIVSMVKYFGGAMLQDQLAWHAHGAKETGLAPEGDLGHGAAPPNSSEVKDLLAWALGGSGTVSEQSLTGPLATAVWDIIKSYIDSGVPMLVTDLRSDFLGGIFNLSSGDVVVGYQEIVEQSATKRRLLLQNPMLTSNFQLRPVDWNSIASAHLLIPVPGNINLQPTDLSVWNEDEDGDGLIDVDEELRFGTLRNSPDSDGDGIDDKTEVWSYVFGRGIVPRSADIDGDGLRAERDDDTDNDNCKDGEEDLNVNGNFVYFPGLKIPYTPIYLERLKEKLESDPFWDDEYELYVETEADEIGFNRTADFDVEVTDVDRAPVVNKMLLVEVVPPSMGTVTNAAPLTDNDGRTTVQFRADHTKGTAAVRVVLDPCRNSTTNPKVEAFDTVDIVHVDYVFVVQDEAVLTGTEELDLPPVYTSGDRVSITHTREKSGGFQYVRGHFFHPEIPDIGKYIDLIRTGYPNTSATLLIDGTPMANNFWVRQATEDNPQIWEIRISAPSPWQEYPFPRTLIVTTTDDIMVHAPLVWWNWVWSHANGVRDFVRAGQPNTYTVKTYENQAADASFFFGDGDSDGMDETWWLWPDQVHTSVSFYPTGTVTGTGITLPAAYGDRYGWWDPLYWFNQTGDVAYDYDVFRYHKSECSFYAPFPWDVEAVPVPDGMTIYDVLIPELTALLPMDIPPLIEHVQYKRDYIESEAEFLAERSLAPLEYTIDMYSSETVGD
jgi:hypothetical protein